MMNNSPVIRDNERIDEFEGLKIIQRTEGPHFSLDAVLLARFASVEADDTVVDLGTGMGIIPLILAANTKIRKIVGIEIQSELADIARRNVSLNRLEDKIEIIQGDLKSVASDYPNPVQFDVVISNPPYQKVGSGRLNPDSIKAIARHEIKCTLDDVLKASFHLLKNRGRAVFVYRPDRLVDLISGCRQNRLEPERLQMVYPDMDKEANLILLETIKNGKQALKVLKPLICQEGY
jgi:tRNA1Val (adenine37-N6)-methyltransferase